ncbi:hypothetical protein [Schnuerera sp.]|uniref:hypothetical protein n=1 Tax=Schnuerera sp. TaxID=2794844 RepID=UPI002C3CC81F|nr:hypothetical protein [Schnuerera sp.]HSH36748.1 hypothetical protein [Schnuerera sp.]
MKKILLSIILITSMIWIVSCDIDRTQLSDNIEAPKNINLPVSGQWRIEEYRMNTTSTMEEEKAESYLGMEILFHNEFISAGEDYFTKPSFRIKNVDAADYLVYNYKTTPDFLDIDTDKIEIVSVAAEQFLYEFIKISDEEIIVNIEGTFFYLNKISEEIQDKKLETKQLTENVLLDTEESLEEDAIKTGILLGLKSLDLEAQNEDMEKWNYRTIFISSNNKEIVSIHEMEDILLPRKTGFWKVKVEREDNDGKLNDNIIAYPLNKTLDQENDLQIKKEEKTENTYKNILYVGNDYISIENIHYRNKGQRYLEFYPIDNITKVKPLMISDVLGEVGKEAFIEGANKEILREKEEYKNSLIDLKPNEESFGLFRRNGYWIFKGRINFVEDGIYRYENFNIKTIPPKEIVYYDELSISWNRIKSKVPEALDVFTSPNEDIAIILTHNNIFVHTLENDKINNVPVEIIELKPAEKIVMAEWAVGRYPKLWEEEFLKQVEN